MPEPTITPEMIPSVPETPKVETPAVVEAPVIQETPVVETPQAPLYDLPDGRKVPGEVVKEEYQNLLKDYTQKSQKLAAYENINKPKEDVPEWKRPEYVPQTYAEVIEIAQRQAIESIKNERLEEENRMKETAKFVDSQIAELRQTDPSLDENALFQHATKYGFRDLKSAHTNFRAIKDAELAAEQRTLKNLKARGIDPVTAASAPGTDTGGIDYNAIAGRNESALDFLRRIKG